MPGTGIIHDQGAYVNDYAIQPLACPHHTFLWSSVFLTTLTITTSG